MASDDDFASLLRASMQSTDDRATRRLAAGELVEARVIQIGADSVFVDVGTTGDGRIERAEFEQGVGAPPLEVGATIRATVVHPNPSAPVLTLALGRGSSVDQAALRAAWESGVPVVGRVQSVVKAGLEVDFGGIRAFCPASQIDVAYVAELGVFEGQELEFRVVEIRDGGRSVVVSRRALLEEQRQARQKALVEQLSVGGEVEGVVHAIQRHGVVVDLGGIEGFVHISEIAHHHVQRIEDELNVGDAVRASVVSIEETSRGVRVRLSLKALVQAPTQPRPPALDEVLDGTVSRTANFGVFVETAKGEGLVPVGQLDLPPGADHRRAFPVGKSVQVVLINRDATTGKLRFSISGVAKVEERRNFREYSAQGAPATSTQTLGSLGDVLRQQLGLPDPEPLRPQSAAERPGPSQPEDPVSQATTQHQAQAPGPAPSQTAARQESRAPKPAASRRPDPDGVVRRRRGG